MRKVLFTFFRKASHSLYHQFLNNPPDGYKYYTLDDLTSEGMYEKMFSAYKGPVNDLYMKIKRNLWINSLAKKK